MNSYLTFNKLTRFLCLLLCLLTLTLCLCSCGEKAVYRINSMSLYKDEINVANYTYTYTEDNKPSTVTVDFPLSSTENYEDSFTYDKNGNMETVTRLYEDMRMFVYTTKKITKHKYILYDKDNKEYSTIVFDESGFIVSYRYVSGLVTEYAFETEKNGKPVSFKQLDIRPSGSKRLVEFNIDYKSGDTFLMLPNSKDSTENAYYEVKFQKITVKG